VWQEMSLCRTARKNTEREKTDRPTQTTGTKVGRRKEKNFGDWQILAQQEEEEDENSQPKSR